MTELVFIAQLIDMAILAAGFFLLGVLYWSRRESAEKKEKGCTDSSCKGCTQRVEVVIRQPAPDARDPGLWSSSPGYKLQASPMTPAELRAKIHDGQAAAAHAMNEAINGDR